MSSPRSISSTIWRAAARTRRRHGFLPDAFYVPDGNGFVATEHTCGPWSATLQHGGPPAALLTREIERSFREHGELQLVRMTAEFLRPIPIAKVVVRRSDIRVGKRAARATASLECDGQETCRISFLAVRPTEGADPPPQAKRELPPPEASDPFQMPIWRWDRGYHTAMEIRIACGTFGDGALAAWMRMRIPLLPDEEPSAAQRIMTAVDSTHGLSLWLQPVPRSFINPDLTVHLHRDLRGEWLLLDSRTTPSERGIGLAEAALRDRDGDIGRSLQSLIRERHK